MYKPKQELILTTRIPETRSALRKLRTDRGRLGFVPTMGAFHEGHISLIRKSLEDNPCTAVSIFVNPTQFNEKQDFDSYPRDLTADLEMLGDYPVDLVFSPSPEEIYPEPDTRVFDLGGLDRVMEGKHRPGHFNGVAQVVSKLFEILRPDKAYFGEKDFQQLAVIRKITADLDLPVEIIGCPIIRENDGLAMSSRNRLLTPRERISAGRIPLSLDKARENAGKMPLPDLIRHTIHFLEEDPLIEPEYFEIVNSTSLESLTGWEEPGEKRACVAARIGRVRLIDNMDFSF